MFDWVEFNPQRLLEPGVIIGLVIVLLGILTNCFARTIASKIALKYGKDEEKTLLYTKLIGLFIVVIGCIIAVVLAS